MTQPQVQNLTADLLSEIIRSVRLEGSVFFRSRLTAPWGMELSTANEPRFHIVLAGSAWVYAHNMIEPVKLTEGSALILTGGEAHWIADHPNSPKVPSAKATEAMRLDKPMFQGARTDCHLLCGFFRFNREIRHPLLSSLPAWTIIDGADGTGLDWLRRTAALMDAELAEGQSGSNAMMDKVCELFVVQSLRHLAKHDARSAHFVVALDDPPVNRALQQIHAAPAEPWKLEDLANIAGLSRSAFAKRFHELVGIPPKAYITMWRMQKARTLLENPYKFLDQIATEVGYSSDVALIRAFQRHFGVSPTEMRKTLIQKTNRDI